jgi:hypothetical protein
LADANPQPCVPLDQGSLLLQRPRPSIPKRIRKIGNKVGPIAKEVSKKMRRTLLKATLLAAIIISVGGWIWLLEVGIRWLIAKL